MRRNYITATKERVAALKLEVKAYEQKLEEQKFRISSKVEDDGKLAFHTGFHSFGALHAFYKYLGPAVDHLFYSSKHAQNAEAINH